MPDRVATMTPIPQGLPEVVAAVGTLEETALLGEGTVTAVVVAVAPAEESDDGIQPRGGTVDAATRYGVDLAELADRSAGASFGGKSGESVSVDLPRGHGATHLPWDGLPGRIVLLGIGRGAVDDYRRAGAQLAAATRGQDRILSAATADVDHQCQVAFVEGYLLGAYRQPRSGSGADNASPQLIVLGRESESAIAEATVYARANWLVRDLANVPANIKNPQWFVDQAAPLVDEAGLTMSVRGPAELAAEGFGGLLAVGAGSASPPRMLVIGYEPVTTARRHIALVGKGITFDTGGLSIKTREAMLPMRTDMTGAAVALAVVVAAAHTQSPHRVTAVIPLAENHVAGSSYRPGDILRTYGGTSIEVLNTDAEGRIVLGDALEYVTTALGPDVVLDIATLTGAAPLGLGTRHAALFTRHDDLAAAIERAGVDCDERVWRLPLVKDYRPALDSPVADVRNIAGALDGHRVGAGAIVAGLFLERFVGDAVWAHVDIAGTARAPGARGGSTGFGARLMLRLLDEL